MKTSIKTRLIGALCAIALLTAVFSGVALTGAAEETVLLTLGDIDFDGKISTTDARLVLQFATEKIEFDMIQYTFGDVSGDGEVNTTDARMILQRAVGKIDSFTGETVTDADMDESIAVVEEYIALYGELGLFTDDSLAALQASLDHTIAVDANENATNEEREDALIRMVIAMYNLEISEDFNFEDLEGFEGFEGLEEYTA